MEMGIHDTPLGTPVLINDTIVSLIGRVCMDMRIVDLRKCKNVNML